LETKTELAATIQSVMKAKQLTREHLAEMLGMNRFMVEKLLCGEVIPSTHLERKLIKLLGISPEQIGQRLAS
jgi:transcriptional regulator with XRE-family HTH domain